MACWALGFRGWVVSIPPKPELCGALRACARVSDETRAAVQDLGLRGVGGTP